ncbi:flagellar hook-basal body protein [Candidatus Latescibacterota bacterium]
MINGIYVAASGMTPRIVQIDNVANNLANASTNGFKKSNVFLRQLIDAQKSLDRAMGIEPTRISEDVRVDYSQGVLDRTGNTFDIALNGSGFFRVRDNEGNVYFTRDGRFNLDPNGMLVNGSGMFLLDNFNNFISMDGNEMAIMGNGDVFIDGENRATIGLAELDLNDYPTLQNIGSGLFLKPAAVNEIPSNPVTKVMQGYLEGSNVDQITTMVDMIELFRSFELGQKAIQIQDQTLQRVVTEVGVVR